MNLNDPDTPDVLYVGQRVTYVPLNTFGMIGKPEKGVIKALCNDSEHVFVVFHCNEDWDDYMNYTGARVANINLLNGWLS